MKRYKMSRNLLVEGDTAATISQVDAEVLVAQIKAMDSGSQEAKEEFFNHLRRRYKIKDANTMSKRMKSLCVFLTGYGYYGTIISVISAAVLAAIRLCSGQIGLFAVDVVFAVIGALLIPAYKKIYERMRTAEVSESAAVIKVCKLEAEKACLESIVVMKKLMRITESANFIENDSGRSVTSVIAKAYNACRDFLKKILNDVTGFVKKHPAFTAAILICIGCVIAYFVKGGEPVTAPSSSSGAVAKATNPNGYVSTSGLREPAQKVTNAAGKYVDVNAQRAGYLGLSRDAQLQRGIDRSVMKNMAHISKGSRHFGSAFKRSPYGTITRQTGNVMKDINDTLGIF